MAKKDKDVDQDHEKQVQVLLRRRPPLPKLRDLTYQEQVNVLIDELQVDFESLDEVRDHVYHEHSTNSEKNGGGPLNALHRNELQGLTVKRAIVSKGLSELTDQRNKIDGGSDIPVSDWVPEAVTEVNVDVRACLMDMIGQEITEQTIKSFFNLLGLRLSNRNNHIETRVGARLAAKKKPKKEPKELYGKLD